LSRLRKVLVATLALVLALLIWVLAFPSEASEHLADAAPVLPLLALFTEFRRETV
jgi:hypothetical protein